MSDEQGFGDGLKLYIGAKLIRAVEMQEHVFSNRHKGITFADKDISRPGYKVICPDGYTSWSPKNAFEDAYREVTVSERQLF